jgi:hypothetical protein
LTSIPDYLSPIQPASINPVFPLDARSEFPKWLDLSGEKLNIELWAKVGIGQRLDGADDQSASSSELEWKRFQSWTTDLSKLIPVPEDVCSYL